MLEGTRPLFRAGSIEFQTKHLLVIAVLALAFSCALIMRFYPIKYGYYLNEFDPYFDYRATKFIVDNGLNAYWQWHDTMSWYPEGRDVPGTSQSVRTHNRQHTCTKSLGEACRSWTLPLHFLQLWAH